MYVFLWEKMASCSIKCTHRKSYNLCLEAGYQLCSSVLGNGLLNSPIDRQRLGMIGMVEKIQISGL